MQTRESETDLGLVDPNDVDPRTQSRLRAWLLFHSAMALSPEEGCALLRRSADPSKALRLTKRAPALNGAALARAERVLAECGARGVPVSSPLYPERVSRLRDAAPLLWVRGDVRILNERCVAIVGARAASAYGRAVANELAADLARSGVVVVSGLARGIDRIAHQSTLDAGGRTIAVLGCGPDRIYPPEHATLAREIERSGAVLSELPAGSPPKAAFFPLRNRLIAALAEVVVVVEARERSGSLITARHALDQGGEVVAVPGPVTAPTSVGPNRLLREGARPVLDASDVLEAMGWEAPAAPRVSANPDRLGAEARALLAVLLESPATRDELAQRTGRSPAHCEPGLIELELEGWIQSDRDGRLVVLRGGAAGPLR